MLNSLCRRSFDDHQADDYQVSEFNQNTVLDVVERTPFYLNDLQRCVVTWPKKSKQEMALSFRVQECSLFEGCLP
jgi:hypothetical protein